MPKKATPRPLAEFAAEPVRLTEGQGGAPRLEGVLAKVDIVNRNKRLYSRKVFEKAINEVQEEVVNGEFTGELDHPDFSALGSLERTAFVFDRLQLEGDLVTFEARLLGTPAGNTLKALLEGGVRVGMSTRGTASIKWEDPKEEGEGGEPIAIIQEDFRLYGADAVKVPSNEAGIARLRESVEARISQTTHQEREENTVTITTVEELRQEFPELVRQVEEAAAEEATEAKTTAEEKVAELEGNLNTANESIATLTAELEEAKQAQEQLAALRTQLLGDSADEEGEEAVGESDLAVAVAALRETVEELKGERDAARAESERLERERTLTAAFEAAVGQSAFANILRDEVDPLAFDSEESLTAEIARLEKLAKRVSGSAGTPGKGKTAVEETPDEPKNDNPYVTERAKRLAGIGEG